MPQNSENASSGMPSPYSNPVAIKHQQKANPDLPDHCYQVFQKSLLEHEYHHEEAFVSASLTRLHHGVYDAGKRLSLYGPPPHNVTFVAITFVFHPMHSIEYRFKRAQISIQAFKTIGEKTTNQPLRITKFAPHIAFG